MTVEAPKHTTGLSHINRRTAEFKEFS